MRYQIANLHYNTADGSLYFAGDEGAATQLSLTANSLLNFFLEHRDIVSRDEVLKKVWDDNGLTASNNNLNQYLSLLRKMFRHYGVDNIIITISRGNLQLNPDVVVEPVDEPEPMPEVELNEMPSAAESPSIPEPDIASSVSLPLPAPEPAKKQNAPGRRLFYQAHQEGMCWFLGGMTLLLISALLLIMTFMGRPSFVTTPLFPMPYERCDLLVSDDMLNAVTHNNYGHNFASVLKKLNLKCQSGERFVFFYGDKLQTNGLGRVFLAHCAVRQDNAFSYCDNYFYYSWKES